MKPHAKRHLVNLLKLAIAAGIIGWLVYRVGKADRFDALWSEPKNWKLFAAAWLLIFSAVLISFVRWYFLVRALDLPFRLRDAFRLGFLGYMFNLVSLGAVGGDLFKAVFLAREQPGRRAEAVATIVADRVLGLYALLLMGSFAALWLDLESISQELRILCIFTWIVTAGMTAFLGVMFLPGCTYGPVSLFLSGLPKVGPLVRSLLRVARTYRRRKQVLLFCVLMTFGIQGLNAIGFYLTARALPDPPPSLLDHFVIVPIALVSGALPFAPGGLGTFELALEFLYQWTSTTSAKGQGFMVALAYRVMTILIAMFGAVFYISRRREVSEVLHEAEEMQEREGAA